MEGQRRLRGAYRGMLTRVIREVEGLQDLDEHDWALIRDKCSKLRENQSRVLEVDGKVMELLLAKEDTPQEAFEEETAAMEEYSDKARELLLRVDNVMPRDRPVSPTLSEFGTAASSMEKRRRFKLPKIELKKFGGDLKEWLGFWSQFQKIDEDDSLHASDKFQYLLLAMEVGSEAKDIVSVYPPTTENYPRAVAALKDRFGNEGLLLQVYIRELLKLVINNVTTKETVPLSKMFITLEGHIRALGVLNLSTADPATWLFPLVESSLPEEVLRAWQRSPLSKEDGKGTDPHRTCLDLLMDFIRSEVKAEQRIDLAQAGFGTAKEKKSVSFASRLDRTRKTEDIPTVAGLHVGEKTICLFCESPHHASKDCGKARNLSLSEKTEMVKKKRCCFICLKKNHLARNCSTFCKCLICDKRHIELMCPESSSNKKTTVAVKDGGVQSLTSNHSGSSTTLLGTFKTVLVNGNREISVRGFYDPGAQRSYLSTRAAVSLGLKPIRQEKIMHTLFGGIKSGVQTVNIFEVVALNKYRKTSKQLTLLEKDKICGDLPHLTKGPWMKEFKEKKIWLEDMDDGDKEIDLLIGADVFGKLLTGTIHQLRNGMTAIETMLGWIVIGPMDESSKCEEPAATSHQQLCIARNAGAALEARSDWNS
jgi:hypothetical protein